MSAAGVDTITLSPDLPLWRDHFPGDPILPGIAQIRLGIDAARRQLGRTDPVGGLSQIKFSRILRPGDTVDLSAAPVEGHPAWVAFSIDSEGLPAARGRIRFGPPDAAPEDAALTLDPVDTAQASNQAQPSDQAQPSNQAQPLDQAQPSDQAQPLEAVLAHRRSMCWLDAVLAHGKAGTRCAIDVATSAAFVGAADRVPSWLALEWMAQTVSAHDNVVRRDTFGPDTKPRIGFLLGTRRLELFAESLDATQPASVEVRHRWGGDGITASFDATVRGKDETPIARARLSCGVPPESASIAT